MKSHISNLLRKSDSDDELIKVLRDHLQNAKPSRSASSMQFQDKSSPHIQELKRICQQQSQKLAVQEDEIKKLKSSSRMFASESSDELRRIASERDDLYEYTKMLESQIHQIQAEQ